MKNKIGYFGLALLTSVLTINAVCQVTLQAPVQAVEMTLRATLTPAQASNALAAVSAVVKLPTNAPAASVRHFQGTVNRDGSVSLVVVVRP